MARLIKTNKTSRGKAGEDVKRIRRRVHFNKNPLESPKQYVGKLGFKTKSVSCLFTVLGEARVTSEKADGQKALSSRKLSTVQKRLRNMY